MLKVDSIKDIRIAHFVEGKGIREISRDFNISRNTVRNVIRSGIIDQSYCRIDKHRPKLGAIVERLVALLKEDEAKPVKHHRRAQILFEQIQREGYSGGYDAVRRYVGAWRKEEGKAPVKAFIPLEYDHGDAFQFDWSYEQVELGGVPVEVKIAPFPLCHSRKPFCILSEWQSLLTVVDLHYHPVLELLLRGVIGSELEGLQKRHLRDNALQIRCAVVKDKAGKNYLKFKPKNWYRKREIPLTGRLKALLEQAAGSSTCSRIVTFEGSIELPANAFLLTMKDGSRFSYNSFRKTVWDKAVKQLGLDGRVPYAARHTFVQWALLVGINKNRLVDLMGHSTKKMIDEVYGFYRKGLIDERQKILDYLGDDFLALEELRTAFPERYGQKMTMPVIPAQIAEAPVLAIAFGQSFGQSQGLYADNY